MVVVTLYGLYTDLVVPFVDIPSGAVVLQFPRLPLAWAAVIFVCGLLFIVWEGGYRRLGNEIQVVHKLEHELDKSKPKLSAYIKYLKKGNMFSTDVLVLSVQMTNDGSDSSVVDYSLQIGNAIFKEPTPYSNNFEMGTHEGIASFAAEDSLQEKTTNSPIRRGEIRCGFLVFMFTEDEKQARQLIRDATDVRLHFRDYLGQPYKVEANLAMLPQ